jgi:hypothetical protein
VFFSDVEMFHTYSFKYQLAAVRQALPSERRLRDAFISGNNHRQQTWAITKKERVSNLVLSSTQHDLKIPDPLKQIG